MLAALLEDLADLALRYEQVLVLWDLTLVNITVTVISCTSSFLFSFFAFDRELAPWITFLIVCDINLNHPRHLFNDRRNVIDADLTILVALKE